MQNIIIKNLGIDGSAEIKRDVNNQIRHKGQTKLRQRKKNWPL